MSDVHRWYCDCEFHNPDWTADKISVVRASDFDTLRAERDRLAEALDRALDSLRIHETLAADYNLAVEAADELDRLTAENGRLSCELRLAESARDYNAEMADRAIDRLTVQLREAQRDAERYRWLFNHEDGRTVRVNQVWRLWDGESDWGAAVDAALAATEPKP